MSDIPFIDLAAQQRVLGNRIQEAINKVLDHGSYIMGPEVFELEGLLSMRAQRRHCVTCASGTDALQMALMALGVQPGDRVIVPDFTFVATAEAVRLVGAEPVFADVDPATYNLDLDSAESAWELPGPLPVGMIAVDLFGHPARSSELERLAQRHDAWLVVDGAQSFGATRDGQSGISHGVIATTSFYPSKPLGAYGDGGAVFCDDDRLASTLRSIRNHGADDMAGRFGRVGLTGRLDTLQAAVLLAKLEVFDSEIRDRQRVAARYSSELSGHVALPMTAAGVEPIWAQYTVEVEGREIIRSRMAEVGIPTYVFYPHPVHANAAYHSFPVVSDGTQVATRASARVMSLPMHPYLDESVQDRIVFAFHSALEGR
jgi:dTDP-4-amino-4,6-dideoxygalactose transaminase